MTARFKPRLALIGIILLYAAIGALYAALTPTWQVPDEPAHYNYIRALAEGGRFPVIEPGDYDQAYLGRLTTEDFPPQLSVRELEYEDHQPPLYYLLAVPVYWLFDGALLPLRLLSVLFGAVMLATAFGVIRTIFPARPEVALAAVALIAFIPQHVAMTAGVNNDGLAELVVGGTLWGLVVYVQTGQNHRLGWWLAVVLLTKTTAYAVLGVAALAVTLRWRQEGRTWRWAVGEAVGIFGPALLLSAPWFIRNGLTYGWLDPLGLTRHNAVVVGQPRSGEWLAAYGGIGLVSRLLRTTFQSFWGQFGWMKVVLPTYIYLALALFSLLAVGGFVWWLMDRRRPALNRSQRAGLALLLALFLLVLLEFLGYNLAFVQHQGRYLFPALIPIGLAAALGICRWALLLPARWRWGAVAVPLIGLAALDLYSLFKYIVPFLTR